MSETTPGPASKSTSPTLAIAGVLVAGLAIAGGVYLYNAGARATECPVQQAEADALDEAATGQLAALGGTGQGRGYSTLQFTDEAGQPRTIADFKGRALLVNFWASWCVPCRAEMPALDAVAAKYNGDSFMVLPINLDIGEGGQEKARAFLEEGGFQHLPLYADSTFEAFERLKREAVAIGLPATLLLDEEGCELAVLQGPAEWHTPDGERVVERLIGLEAEA